MKKYIEIAREQLTYYGTHTDIQHILAVLIGPKADPGIIGNLSSKGIRELSDMTIQDMKEFGLSDVEAQRVYAGFQLGRKWFAVGRETERPTVRSPQDVYAFLEDMRFLSQEHFVVLCLNTKNQILLRETVFVGSLNSSIVHPREVLGLAIKKSAASIIVSHNHPSGDPSPSREDIEVTRRLIEAGKIVGIDLLDHLIIGDGRYYSLKEKGHFV